MNNYKLQAPYEPNGDQPEAIKKLVKGVNTGKQFQTLLGATAVSSDSNSQLFLKSIDVKKIFSDHQSNIFKIIDLLLQKNINESLIEINYSLQKGEPALRLNAGLISQIRIHTIIKLAVNSGNDNAEKICNLAGISNPKRIFFIRRKVKNVSQEYLINLMSNLLDIESLIKQGNNPINVFTEKLINLS